MRGELHNVSLPAGAVIYVLRDKDMILADDLCRATVYTDTGSDYIDFHTVGQMNWQQARHAVPAWVKKTVAEYRELPYPKEFIRILKR